MDIEKVVRAAYLEGFRDGLPYRADETSMERLFHDTSHDCYDKSKAEKYARKAKAWIKAR